MLRARASSHFEASPRSAGVNKKPRGRRLLRLCGVGVLAFFHGLLQLALSRTKVLGNLGQLRAAEENNDNDCDHDEFRCAHTANPTTGRSETAFELVGTVHA